MQKNVLHTSHERSFETNRFVYPVLSRRSQGVSIGVNLNPDKICNFDCVYCQVDRTTTSETQFVEMAQLVIELDQMLEMVTTGALFETRHFAQVPTHLQRLNDIAFSGDGEPTTYRNFDEIIDSCAALKRKHQLDTVKMVLITNASMFHREHVKRGLEMMDANQGEIWAKLDAGTQQYYQMIERTSIPFQQVLDNIEQAARLRPIVIQSLFMRINNEGPDDRELEMFCERLAHVTRQGGEISLVQIYTVARKPTESFVTPLADVEVDRIVELVNSKTGLQTVGYYGYSS
ncbi:MAG: radical SAM protein [Planctomycetaceae bacterium]|mgnify:CR=1 FL=1|nr:radical SAM protein [Planctomycetaceae bacterium]